MGEPAEELRYAQLEWAHRYDGYQRLAGGSNGPSQLERLLTTARREWRDTGRIPTWCGVDLLRGWAFYLARSDHHTGGTSLQPGGPDEREFLAVLHATDTHPATRPNDRPPLTPPPNRHRSQDVALDHVLGDNDPWNRHLITAWRACAHPDLASPPSRPPIEIEHPDDWETIHSARIAYFAPLLHLLLFGLGWTRPGQGIRRWIDAGRPVEEPVLRVVDHWWSIDLEGFAQWLAANPFSEATLATTLTGTPSGDGDAPAPARLDRRWHAIWGGGTDPMHLTGHVDAPVRDLRRPTTLIGPHTDTAGRPRAALTLDSYVGWYRALQRLTCPTRMGSHDLRVDVTSTPVGWLGQYRRSTMTGLWFRTSHAVHMLGN